MPIPADLLSAVVAYWDARTSLGTVIAGPFFSETDVDAEPPYCVMSVPTTRRIVQGTRGDKQVQSSYQFAVYDRDQDTAVDLGRQVTAALDGIHRAGLTFADGYLMAWDWESELLMEVPEAGKANTIWRQTHTYTADIVNTRAHV
jgi:hypothetical protein